MRMKIKRERYESPAGKWCTAIVKAFAVQRKVAKVHVGMPEVNVGNVILVAFAQFGSEQRISPRALPPPRQNSRN